jgi:large subunit ribosomal protein L15
MAKGGKAKKMRGNHTHGRGKKAGRGAGLKGGRGRAGAHKHRRVMLQQKGGKHAHMAARPWGRIGFKSKSRTAPDVTLNVGQVEARFPGAKEVDLAEAGYTKLLGNGTVSAKMTIKVAKATATAVEKVEAAGGKVVTE